MDLPLEGPAVEAAAPVGAERRSASAVESARAAFTESVNHTRISLCSAYRGSTSPGWFTAPVSPGNQA